MTSRNQRSGSDGRPGCAASQLERGACHPSGARAEPPGPSRATVKATRERKGASRLGQRRRSLAAAWRARKSWTRMVVAALTVEQESTSKMRALPPPRGKGTLDARTAECEKRAAGRTELDKAARTGGREGGGTGRAGSARCRPGCARSYGDRSNGCSRCREWVRKTVLAKGGARRGAAESAEAALAGAPESWCGEERERSAPLETRAAEQLPRRAPRWLAPAEPNHCRGRRNDRRRSSVRHMKAAPASAASRALATT